MIRAGQYRDRFRLQSYTEGASDGAGGYADPTWSTVATVWAKDRPLTGSERYQSAQVTGDVSREVEVRFRDGVTTRMRLQGVGSTGTIYGIEAAFDPDRRRERLLLLCREGDPTAVLP